jgi:sarcosine oxidase
MDTYDVIIVGLGCVGISTAYYCSKNGMKVLGFEQFSKPGSLGSSSFGETRLWRVTHGNAYKNRMMRDAVKLWREIEQEAGVELIVQFPVLTIGSPENENIVSIFNQYPDHKVYSPEEISEKFPALRNLPKDYKGILHDECGIVRARRALDHTSRLAQEKYGANLNFNTKITKIAADHVVTSDGVIHYAQSVIICCGAYSKEFDDKKISHKRELEYYVIDDIKGMPNGIMEFPADGSEYYGMLDGENLDQYKMGQFNPRNLSEICNYFRERLPDKVDKVKYVHP